MIYLQLEQIGRSSDAIQLDRELIAVVFLWVAWIDVLDESRPRSDIAQDRFLQLWDRIHLANPAPAAIYLDTLLRYLDVDNSWVTERPGLEQGARAASICLLRALSSVDLAPTTLEGIHKSYVAVIPRMANFDGLRCYHAINAIHATLMGGRRRRFFEWTGYEPHTQEHVFFTDTLARIAHKGKQDGKVPRWILRFVIHSMSHDPPPPIPVITDCLTIIAIDLECDVSHARALGLSGRYVDLWRLWVSLIVKVVHNQRRF